MKKSWILMFSLITLFAVAGCSIKPVTEDAPTNYLRQQAPTDTPVVFAPGIVSVKGRFDMGLTISPDRKTIAFGVVDETAPDKTSIHFLSWENNDWSGPDTSPLPGNTNTLLPMFSPRGDQLFFTKTDTKGDSDFWVGDFMNNKVTNIKPLGAPVNSAEREAGHGKSLNGTFYFTSNRDDAYQCCGDVYRVSSLESDQVERVNALSSDADEEGLFLSPKEDYIIIQAWKSEFQSKHDLYISYKTVDGRWTAPKRLNDKINGPEIEQRPYITPDNRFLFFSRMSIKEKVTRTFYESDIYWVNTNEVFAPFLNRNINTFPVPANSEFDIQLPEDLFKDINDQQLDYKMTNADGSALNPELSFDPVSMKLTGNLKGQTSMTVLLTATDDHGNSSSTYLEIIEEK